MTSYTSILVKFSIFVPGTFKGICIVVLQCNNSLQKSGVGAILQSNSYISPYKPFIMGSSLGVSIFRPHLGSLTTFMFGDRQSNQGEVKFGWWALTPHNHKAHNLSRVPPPFLPNALVVCGPKKFGSGKLVGHVE